MPKLNCHIFSILSTVFQHENDPDHCIDASTINKSNSKPRIARTGIQKRNRMCCHISALLLQQLKHQRWKIASFDKDGAGIVDIPLSSEQASILYIPGIKEQPASTRTHHIHPPLSHPSCWAPPLNGHFQQAIGWCAGGEVDGDWMGDKSGTLISYASVLSRKRPG